MRDIAERAWFHLCLVFGLVLGRVRRRRFILATLVQALDTGVRILPRREEEERERQIQRSLGSAPPLPPERTLAALLGDPDLQESTRRLAIGRAVDALARLHHAGFTHAYATAEHVLVDVRAKTARWIDFHAIHETDRPEDWRRADDLRTLLVDCLARTAPERRDRTIRLILSVYPAEGITLHLEASFDSVWRRSLIDQLSQAGLSFRTYREIGRLLRNHRAH